MASRPQDPRDGDGAPRRSGRGASFVPRPDRVPPSGWSAPPPEDEATAPGWDVPPPPDAPPPDAHLSGRVARSAPPGSIPRTRPGAARADAVPRMETVRVTAPDLRRRALLQRTRSRLTFTAGGFVVLFLALLVKLSLATVFDPLRPPPRQDRVASLLHDPAALAAALPAHRAMITDRHGQILAISLPFGRALCRSAPDRRSRRGGGAVAPGAARSRRRPGGAAAGRQPSPVRLSRPRDHAGGGRGGQRPRHPGDRLPAHRDPPLPDGPARRAGAGRRRYRSDTAWPGWRSISTSA